MAGIMSLLSTLTSLQTPLALILILFGPSVLPRLLTVFRLRPRPTPHPNFDSPRPPLPTLLKLILALHILGNIYNLFVPPYDLFASHHLPIVSTSEKIRTALVAHHFNSITPSHNNPSSLSTTIPPGLEAALDVLVQKLSSLDARLAYARVGHQPFKSCLWCRSLGDYLIAALPTILAVYAGHALLIGCMASKWLGGDDGPRRAERWRGMISWVLGVGACLDIGVRYLWELSIVDGDCLHLSSTIHTLRTFVLLALPIIYLLLPVSSKTQPQLQLLHALSMTRTATRLGSLARGAASRSPLLFRAWLEGLGLRNGIAAAAREDDLVRTAAREIGRGSDASEVEKQRERLEAKNWLDHEWASVVSLGTRPGVQREDRV